MRVLSNGGSNRRRSLVLASALVAILLLGMAAEVSARGRGGGRGGGGGGFRGGGNISRGGPARAGSIRNGGAGGGYRSYQGSRRPANVGGGRSREGSFENRRGETIDYSGSARRTPDGIEREGSWTSTSGASGGGAGRVDISDGRVQSTERTRHAESADGRTLDREVNSQRHGDHVDREGKIQSNTGIDAETKGRIIKTDDGFIARGGIAGDKGAAAGTIVRNGDQTLVRGVATDGNRVTWGGARCKDSRCYGGRVSVDRNDYYVHPYYYYPYYYGWYSCPYGSVQTWYSRYGTPVYGCSNVVVVQTTISLGPSASSVASGTDSSSPAWPEEAVVSSAPVLMYEASSDVSVYGTTYEPSGVYNVEQAGLYYWVPGPAEASKEAEKWIGAAREMDQPTANSTVITYAMGDRIVYLTNEAPLAGIFSEKSDHLYVWMPGVTDPTGTEKEIISTVIEAQQSGGKDALDREVRKLQANREPPPARPEPEKASVGETS